MVCVAATRINSKVNPAMTTPQRKAAPASEGRSPGIISQHVATPSITTDTPRGYFGIDAWQANFRRMARRANADPAFSDICGSGIRQLADQLKASRA